MLKKKTKVKSTKLPIVKKLTMKEKMKVFKGDILRGEYDEEYLKKLKLYERTVHRKMRYWCFKIRHATVDEKQMPNYPDGLKEFVESLPGFAGWKHFAKSWDIYGNNPFMIVLRLQSVWEEWDHVMNRVAIPIDSPPEQIHERMEALAEDYTRKNK